MRPIGEDLIRLDDDLVGAVDPLDATHDLETPDRCGSATDQAVRG
jgi:hypothetical protein